MDHDNLSQDEPTSASQVSRSWGTSILSQDLSQPSTINISSTASSSQGTQPSTVPTSQEMESQEPRYTYLLDHGMSRQNLVKERLGTFITEISSEKEAKFFLRPVNPEIDLCPDYHQVIKQPMDLSTMRHKLQNTDEYFSDPWNFVRDFKLMISNAIVYNKGSISNCIADHAVKLDLFFKDKVTIPLQSIGLCCGQINASFRCRSLACYANVANTCHIPRNEIYYSDTTEEYSVCKPCFTKWMKSGNECKIYPDQKDATNRNFISVDSNNFREKLNDFRQPEPWIKCCECNWDHHRICVNFPPDYYKFDFRCDYCLREKMCERPENRYLSKYLPQTNLGFYIENRVRHLLDENLGPNRYANIHVRVVSTNSNREVQVKESMRLLYSPQFFPPSFPYVSKAIFAFQDQKDGSEICFFGMHVNEYSHEAHQPNSRRIYLSYLDSVFFFEPKECRTVVYREIILSYLRYAKDLGYRHACIWSCPPSENDDYIFYAHPEEQKIPKSQRLLDWYATLFDYGVSIKVLQSWTRLLDQKKKDNMRKVFELPYFDGDFWPKHIEESIEKLMKEASDDSNSNDSCNSGGFRSRSCSKSGAPKSHGKKSGKNKKSAPLETKSRTDSFDDRLNQEIMMEFDKHADVFFSLNLVADDESERDIMDFDADLNCPLFDGREAFLIFCRTSYHQFSSLRHAKYSTSCMTKRIHDSFTESSGRYVEHHTLVHRPCFVKGKKCSDRVCHRFIQMKKASAASREPKFKMIRRCATIHANQGSLSSDWKFQDLLHQSVIHISLYHLKTCQLKGKCSFKFCRNMKRLVKHTYQI